MTDETNDQLNFDPHKADRAIAETIDASGKAESNEIHLSTGVVLIAKQANPNMLIRAMTAQRRPTPPTYFSKEMGREMENPDDPDYISRVQSWQMEYSNGMLNVLIGLGTELKTMPRGMEGPDPKIAYKAKCTSCGTKTEKDSCPKCGAPVEHEQDPLAWVADYKALGFPVIPNSPAWRYITWVMFKAAPTSEDVALISEKVKNLSGIKEANVKDAETFPERN
jgi:hypothetical protein